MDRLTIGGWCGTPEMRKRVTMIELRENSLVFRFPEVHEKAVLAGS